MSEYKDKVLFLGDSICRHYFPFASEFLEQNSEIEGVLPDKWTSCQWKQVRYAQSAFVEKRRYNGRKFAKSLSGRAADGALEQNWCFGFNNR